MALSFLGTIDPRSYNIATSERPISWLNLLKIDRKLDVEEWQCTSEGSLTADGGERTVIWWVSSSLSMLVRTWNMFSICSRETSGEGMSSTLEVVMAISHVFLSRWWWLCQLWFHLYKWDKAKQAKVDPISNKNRGKSASLSIKITFPLEAKGDQCKTNSGNYSGVV